MNATEIDRILNQASYDKAINKAEANIKRLKDYTEQLCMHRDTYQHTPSACFYYAAVALQTQRQIEVALDAMGLGHHQSGVVGLTVNELKEKLAKTQAELPLVRAIKASVKPEKQPKPTPAIGQVWLRRLRRFNIKNPNRKNEIKSLETRLSKITDIGRLGGQSKLTLSDTNKTLDADCFIEESIYVGDESILKLKDTELIDAVSQAILERNENPGAYLTQEELQRVSP